MKKNNEKIQGGTVVDHLVELRSRLLNTFIFLFFSFIVCYFFSENIYSFLVNPYAEAIIQSGLERRLIFTALHEAFLTY